MQPGFQPHHFELGGSPVKDANQRGLGVIGPPGVSEVVDVVDGILGLSLDEDGLVFVHVPGVLCIHGDRPLIADHLHVDAVRLNVGEFDIKGGGGCGSVVVGSNRREGLPTLGG